MEMAKGYWVVSYRKIKDPQKVDAYAKIAGAAVLAGGGRFVARGIPVKVCELGQLERTTVVEFESVEKAVACRESEGYRQALEALGDAVERDFRIMQGAE
jgi:uncharacterized protein (DUF1330 family)